MKVVGKTFVEYYVVSKVFLALIFFLTVMIVVLRLRFDLSPSIRTLLSLPGIFVIVLAGWRSASKFEFNKRQTGIVGLLLSFGTHWSLPLFHTLPEVFLLFLINSVIFSVITILGAWLVGRIKPNK